MRQQRILRNAYLHFVWTTYRRLPWVTADIEHDVYSYIRTVCTDDKCDLLALGGMPDHIHLLVNYSNIVSFAQFMPQVKGGSSRLISQKLKPGETFAWRPGYAIFSVSRPDLNRTIAYVNNEKHHHAVNKLWPALENLPDWDETDEPAE